MCDSNRSTTRILNLIGRAGVYETLLAMFNHGDTTTFARIVAVAGPRALSHLRALAAEGFVVSASIGTWDTAPPADTPFSLTTAGHGVVGHLNGFRESARESPWPRGRA